MKTINNTEPMPMTPEGCEGDWVWNGFEITSTARDSVTNELFQRKGQWQWVANDTQNAWMADASVKEINEFYKPQSKERIGEVLNKAILALAIGVGIAVIASIIIL